MSADVGTPVLNCQEPLGESAPASFEALAPPLQQCDEPLPPYRIIAPIYDGHFVDRFPQLDAVWTRSYLSEN